MLGLRDLKWTYLKEMMEYIRLQEVKTSVAFSFEKIFLRKFEDFFGCVTLYLVKAERRREKSIQEKTL